MAKNSAQTAGEVMVRSLRVSAAFWSSMCRDALSSSVTAIAAHQIRAVSKMPNRVSKDFIMGFACPGKGAYSFTRSRKNRARAMHPAT